GSEYLVFLDADDWIQPRFIARLHEEIRSNEQVRSGDEPAKEPAKEQAQASPAHLPTSSPAPASAISHAYCQERLVEKGTGIWRVPDWDPLLMMVTNIHPVTALVRRECFQA